MLLLLTNCEMHYVFIVVFALYHLIYFS